MRDRSLHKPFVVFLLCGTLAATSLAADDVIPLTVAESRPVDYATHHVQGLEISADAVWISSVERAAKCGWILRLDRATLKVVASRKLAIGDEYHPGGIQVQADSLWVPLAEYRPRSRSHVLRLDPQTLEDRGGFEVPDHLGGIAADGQGRLYAANWDCRTFYVFDEQGAQRFTHDNPTGVAYQDVKWDRGLIFGTGQTNIAGKRTSVVDVIEPEEWRLVRRYTLAGKTRSGGADFGREGFAKFERSFYLLPEDGPRTTIYRFGLPEESGR